MEKIYTLKEVSIITRQSMPTIYRHLSSGLLKANKVGGTYRVTEKQLKEYTKGE